MKHFYTMLTVSILASASNFAFAAEPHLTPAECQKYPFAPLTQPVTHKKLQRELGELEAAGYHPGGDDGSYPHHLEKAKAALQSEYQNDCAAPTVASNAH
ncbi:DUF4148 domain-containing protein [Caballeronia sp. DA-9]|uniref:DUF4148 domain-containing protein n=1 Tax=Caballeronia sp. DA-9 TaxID=3436237 RepID=UPI003F6784B4